MDHGMELKTVEELQLGPDCRKFTYAQLETATKGYPETQVVGEGGFGKARSTVLSTFPFETDLCA